MRVGTSRDKHTGQEAHHGTCVCVVRERKSHLKDKEASKVNKHEEVIRRTLEKSQSKKCQIISRLKCIRWGSNPRISYDSRA